MAEGQVGFKRWLLAGGVAMAAIVLTAAFVWRDDILQAALDPKVPYQTYRPPPPPDYGQRKSWALIPDRPAIWTANDLPADVFFIHPTTFDGGRDWNAPIGASQADRLLNRVMLPNYAGPFFRVGRLFAPKYRQASLYSQLTLRDDARDARRFAYGDVREAFRYYLEHYNRGRPLVLVGVEQGGLMAQRLLRDEIAPDRKLVNRLAGVYLVDVAAPRTDYDGPKAGPIPSCSRRNQARCVVGWIDVWDNDHDAAQQALDRALVWKGDQLVNLDGRDALCVNPLVGKETDEKVPTRANLGAANVSGLEWGTRPAFLVRQVSTQCVGGVLRVSKPKSPSLKESGGWADRLKEPAFNLFYADLEADAQARVASLLNLPDFPKPAPPIEKSIEVGMAPVHRID
ncbi:DUF3089 domain-containing protein [Caulobacter sp. CCUG 60055]|uniref:DUF3089 domain-containing protein n=1 Tax=Caulobacter sp. CCUG 60055 TaxID=2100090 RepID=UPI001FA7C14A|nr:DUF3089 domain-containing protein [Caulobacter sp. CCUG 60055]MBQ1540700.1 DUF3089 domain-containing protein [Caulobacteraceae bacterium]MCI3178943.1 DUF3089 domain-containing protein [Caulobacter sp. CCUG 60055]